MLKYVAVYESFLCMQKCGSYCKKRIALQKCLTFLLERERDGEREREREREREEQKPNQND